MSGEASLSVVSTSNRFSSSFYDLHLDNLRQHPLYQNTIVLTIHFLSMRDKPSDFRIIMKMIRYRSSNIYPYNILEAAICITHTISKCNSLFYHLRFFHLDLIQPLAFSEVASQNHVLQKTIRSVFQFIHFDRRSKLPKTICIDNSKVVAALQYFASYCASYAVAK